jgi:hypothetical protein
MNSDQPKTDFLVSAENEYLARKSCQIFGRLRIFDTRQETSPKCKFLYGKKLFPVWQLQVAVDVHDLWANIHAQNIDNVN